MTGIALHCIQQFVTVTPVIDDNIQDTDDIEPIDGGVEQEKPAKFVSPFTRAENRYSKGRPINNAQMLERINNAYMLMLQGGSRRENACQLATRYGVSFRQAENYIAEAQKLMKEDFAGERAQFLNQVNNMRMHTVKKALKRGNYQVVAQLLDSLGRAMGEGSVEDAANQAPTLNITVEDKRASS
jgi:hypothetical protein